MMDRREFAAGLLAAGAVLEGRSSGQAPGPAKAELKPLISGVYRPGAGKGMQAGHESHPFLAGMLPPGNIRLEAHESVQQAGAEHEAVGFHKHSEIWCVQRGVASLYINGTEHRMEAGDVGLVCAGDQHWIKNAGEGELAYFVLAVGPPE